MAFVKAIASDALFSETLAAADPAMLVVVDFSASWCQPCKQIKPFYAELASRYKHVLFCTVDIDVLKETAAKNSIASVPTFHFYKNAQLVDSFKGADPRQLQAFVDRLQGPQIPLNNSSVGAHIALTEFIDKKQIECLNQSDEHTVFSIFGNDPKQYLESDVDEQLIIVIPFNQMVKVHSLKITGPKGNAPSTIKTYINRPVTLSFEEADAVEAVEVIDVTPLYQPDSVAATEQSSSSSTAAAETITAMVPLRFVKYQNVSSLTVFVGQNVGRADTTVVNKVVVYGSPVESTKSLSELKKDGHEH